MGAALPYATRRRIIEGYQNGQSCAELAREFQVAYATARVLCRRFDAEGDDGLVPRYPNCGATGIRSERLLYRAACHLKRRHPTWGAPIIRQVLEERYPERKMPGVRTMQTWFKDRGLVPPRSKPPKPENRWAKQVHEVWQVDAKEHQQTADHPDCCWLTFTDEHSGALIKARVFPPSPDRASTA